MVRIENRNNLKQDFIQKIGPWAFYSINRKYWPELSDREIIEGALLHAPDAEKYELLDIYDLKEIREVWEKYVVIQAEWHRAANIWVAEKIFKAQNAERFVK